MAGPTFTAAEPTAAPAMPVLRHDQEAKSAKDALLFFGLGDFFELFWR